MLPGRQNAPCARRCITTTGRRLPPFGNLRQNAPCARRCITTGSASPRQLLHVKSECTVRQKVHYDRLRISMSPPFESQNAPCARGCITTRQGRGGELPREVRMHRAPEGALRPALVRTCAASGPVSECTVRQKVHYDQTKITAVGARESECTVRQKVHYDKSGKPAPSCDVRMHRAPEGALRPSLVIVPLKIKSQNAPCARRCITTGRHPTVPRRRRRQNALCARKCITT